MHETVLMRPKVWYFATAFWVGKRFGAFEKRAPKALFFRPKISVCIFGNSQSQFLIRRVLQFLGSSFWILDTQFISFQLLGSQFLGSYWRPVPWVFVEDCPVRLLLPCTFPLSRFPVVWKNGEFLFEWKAWTVCSQWLALVQNPVQSCGWQIQTD